MFNTILVCSDGSDHALKAAQQAAVIAKQSDACVLLLNVGNTKEVTPCIMPWQLELGDAHSALDQETEQEIILNNTAKLFEEADVRYQILRECGHPAAQIVRVAEHEGADLIVLGSRGLGLLKSMLLGSVSDHVVHHAPCSVLIVR